ncbi:hypothetical protein ACTHRK_17400 [Dietzia cercidiphylli]|uniref:hypothetical protein n=1 Tax=Dietzia cercidiphylli TaxID=498199 RepID=UPI003F81F1F4
MTAIAGGSAQVPQKFSCAGVSEFGDGPAVRAVGTRVEVGQANDGAMPPQQLEEQPLPCLVGGSTDLLQ